MTQKKICILGGGVAGMSAAHELAERGFSVDVFDRNPLYVGGKARSVNVPDTNIISPDGYLPGEHGFRFFPGFYKHVTDTMKRIPFKDGKSVFDNLVSTDTVEIAQKGLMPIIAPVHFPTSWENIVEIFESFMQAEKELSKAEIDFFSMRIWQLMTSCSDRFLDEYESISWWEYLKADTFSSAYQTLLVDGLTRSLVACQAQMASTRTVGTIFLQLLYLMIDIDSNTTDRVLNGPTNDQWLNPWLAYLQSLKVNYNKGQNVTQIFMKDGLISGAELTDINTKAIKNISGYDYYLLCTPVERAAALINNDMLKVDESLQNIIKLAPNVRWMNGIQFYLNKEVNLNKGHTIYSNSHWALTSISQIQFWAGYDLKNKGNGKVVSILSVDISDWTALGNFNNKAAEDCTRDEVKEEVWKQLKEELNIGGTTILSDDMIEFVYLDRDIHPVEPALTGIVQNLLTSSEFDSMQKLNNREPLLVNQTDTWCLRPNAFTAIANLFLAADYVKTNTDLATMEGANEAARRAVNNILKVSGSDAPLCEIWKYTQPSILGLFQDGDKNNYAKGLTWQQPFVDKILLEGKKLVDDAEGLVKKIMNKI